MVKLRRYKNGLMYSKCKASTLIETIIAMVIVSISFGIGVTIYMNMHTSGNSVTRLKAYMEANNLLNSSLHEENFMDMRYTRENIQVVKESIPYPQNSKLKILVVRVYDLNEKEIYCKKRIIYPSKYEQN